MKEFLQNRAVLMQKFTELRARHPDAQGTPDGPVAAEFQKENADLLKRQRELAQIIGEQQARNPVPPPPLAIPPNASPELKNFLTVRSQLLHDQYDFLKAHEADDPATRQTAMAQWRQENATRFAQMQQLAQALSRNNNTPNLPRTN